MKKAKNVPMSTPNLSYCEDAKGKLKLQTLMQDYQELQQETEEAREMLREAKRRKLFLLAEVQFLRKRYQFLLMNQRASRDLSNGHQDTSTTETVGQKEGRRRGKEVQKRSPPRLLDLNKISDPREADEADLETPYEPFRLVKQRKKCFVEGETSRSEVNLSVCRDLGSLSSRSGKRRISWQDQVALKV